MLRGTRILLMTILVAATEQAPAAENRSESFGDWGFVCNTPDSQEGAEEVAKENCNLFQTALLNNEQSEAGQRVLLTRIGYLEGNELPMLLITAPLGILLPMGITVEVEGHDPIRIPVQRCDGGGCLAYVAMEDAFLTVLKKGTEAKVTFYDVQRRGVAIPLSLKGITKGMQALDAAREE